MLKEAILLGTAHILVMKKTMKANKVCARILVGFVSADDDADSTLLFRDLRVVDDFVISSISVTLDLVILALVV